MAQGDVLVVLEAMKVSSLFFSLYALRDVRDFPAFPYQCNHTHESEYPPCALCSQMETPVLSPKSGTVVALKAQQSKLAGAGTLLAVIKEDS